MDGVRRCLYTNLEHSGMFGLPTRKELQEQAKKSVFKIIPEKNAKPEEIKEIFENFQNEQRYYISKLSGEKFCLGIMFSSFFAVLFHNYTDNLLSGESRQKSGIRGTKRFLKLLILLLFILAISFRPDNSFQGTLEI